MRPTTRFVSPIALLLGLAVVVSSPVASATESTPGGAGGAAAPEEFPLPFAADDELELAGRRLGHLPGGNYDKAAAIIRFIFQDRDGLQFKYRRYPTLNADEAFEQHAGNCLSLVNLYIALARAAGLDAFPVQVEDFVVFSRHDGTVVRSTHVVGGLNISGQMLTVDFLPDREKAYRRLTPISDQRHAALYYNAVAVEAMFDGDDDRAATLFQHALELEPQAAETWNNYGVFARRHGDLPTAMARLEQALERDRNFLPAINNLAGLYRISGRPHLAQKMEKRALEAKYQNPFFLVDQSVRRIYDGELDDAEHLLQRARRIDPSIPEVYVALGRIDLLRGRTDRAERNFEAARKHSLELSPAFQRGVDRKIDRLLQVASNRPDDAP